MSPSRMTGPKECSGQKTEHCSMLFARVQLSASLSPIATLARQSEMLSLICKPLVLLFTLFSDRQNRSIRVRKLLSFSS